MGDMFVRNADGSLDFVDRLKYMIKSGGENIYPAEIERVLLADPGVADAVVVRRPDPTWGEVPVAVVARKDETLTSARLLARCRAELAGYKQPKDFVFVTLAELPRSTTGKIQRHEVEAWLRSREADRALDSKAVIVDISCAFPPVPDTPDHIALAERLGYRRAWVYDTPALQLDVWMTLARAAERTRRIELGPGVLIPSLRRARHGIGRRDLVELRPVVSTSGSDPASPGASPRVSARTRGGS
jgi:hypothetical protein